MPYRYQGGDHGVSQHAPKISTIWRRAATSFTLLLRSMSIPLRPPHPATIPHVSTAQQKRAEGQRPPHPATLVTAKTPHPATIPHASTAQQKRAEGPKPQHPATLVTAKAPHPATVAQRRSITRGAVQRMMVVHDNVFNCVHCNNFLKADALRETSLVKVTKCIFKSSLYVLSKRHKETDGLEEAIDHLHETVKTAEELGWYQITHVTMNITKKKDGSYNGYEHFHSFIVFDDQCKELESKYQNCTKAQWARDMTVGTKLSGSTEDSVYAVQYAPDRYELAIVEAYSDNRMVPDKGLYPCYFAIEFKNGKATTTNFAI